MPKPSNRFFASGISMAALRAALITSSLLSVPFGASHIRDSTVARSMSLSNAVGVSGRRSVLSSEKSRKRANSRSLKIYQGEEENRLMSVCPPSNDANRLEPPPEGTTRNWNPPLSARISGMMWAAVPISVASFIEPGLRLARSIKSPHFLWANPLRRPGGRIPCHGYDLVVRVIVVGDPH